VRHGLSFLPRYPSKTGEQHETIFTVGLAWLQVPLGAAAVEGLHAQAKPPVGLALKGC